MNTFYARPVMPLLIAGIAGIYLGTEFPGHLLWAAGIIVLCTGILITFLIRHQAARVLPLLLMLALGYLSIQPWTAPRIPPQHISHFLDDRRLDIEGIIDSRPMGSEGRRKFYLRSQYLDSGGKRIAVTGKIRVTAVGNEPQLYRGERVLLNSRLRSIRNFNNPGGFDYRRYMSFQNVWATAYVSAERIRHLEKPSRDDRSRMMDVFRARISRIIEDSGEGPSIGVLKALVVGDRSAISRPLRDAFNRAGVGHLLAISGLHIGIVASVAFFCFKWLLAYLTPLVWTARTRKGAALLSLLPVVLYGIVAGFSPSTQRAVIMVCIFLMTFLFEREHDLSNTLALAALVILTIFPPSLFSISFQLSFMAVWSIIFGLNRLQRYRRVPDPADQSAFVFKLKWRLVSFFFVSLFAIGGTLPLTMYYFNQISVVGIFANFIIVPLVGFIVVPVGLVAAFLSPISMMGALWCFKVCHAVLRPALATIEFLAGIPFAALKTITPSVLEIACYYLLVWAFLRWLIPDQSASDSLRLSLQSGHRDPHESCTKVAGGRLNRLPGAIQKIAARFAVCLHGEDRDGIRRKLSAAIAVLVILVLLGDAGYWYYRRFGRQDLRITVIDVGSGNAALLELPGGHTMLIDGGGFSDNSVFDIGGRVLAPLLWRQKIRTVDTLILTHPNSDHLNGLLYIAEHFNVGRIWTNGETRDTVGYCSLMDIIAAKNIQFPGFGSLPVRGMIHGVGFSILYPQIDFIEKKTRDKWRNSNNNSLVIRISFGAVSFLFPGDIMAAAERELTQMTNSQLDSTVLMAPHHGSRTSSTDVFLDAVNPQICVISCGWKSHYKFPHPEVLQRYERRGYRTYRTDSHGAVTFITDGQELEVRPLLSKIERF